MRFFGSVKNRFPSDERNNTRDDWEKKEFEIEDEEESRATSSCFEYS